MLDLLSLEEAIALAPRATPTNVFAEIQRLSAVLERGDRLRPSFTYGPLPDLSFVRGSLERVSREAASSGRVGALYAARAAELELEARLVEKLGAPDFAELAGERFRRPSVEVSGRVDAFVADALSEPEPPLDAGTELFASDDRASPASLFQQVLRHAAELALPVRVERRPGQLAVAATGDGIVAIRPGVMLTRRSATRIALHELLGHALPRLRSRRATIGLLRAGTAGSVEHEEGRALVIEARAGLLDRPRRRELALRHLAACAVRSGADFHETVRELGLSGASPGHALEIGARVHRGGGLAREIVYLPAYFEIQAAFSAEPTLEQWFERGRVGLAAARELSRTGDLGEMPAAQASNSISTGV